jgi:hypothetical protein
VSVPSPPPGLSEVDAHYVESVLRRHSELATATFRETPRGLELVAQLKRKGDAGAVAEQLRLELAGAVASVVVLQPGALPPVEPARRSERPAASGGRRVWPAAIAVLAIAGAIVALTARAVREIPSPTTTPVETNAPPITQRDVDGVRYLLLGVTMLPPRKVDVANQTARFDVALALQRLDRRRLVVAPMRLRAADGRAYERIARQRPRPTDFHDLYVLPRDAARDVWLEILGRDGGVRARMALPIWVGA